MFIRKMWNNKNSPVKQNSTDANDDCSPPDITFNQEIQDTICKKQTENVNKLL